MNDQIVHAKLPRHARDLDRVPVDRVDASGTKQTDQVQSVARSRPRESLEQDWIAGERAVGYGGIDARQVLQDRPPCAEVEVADLAVAHLPNRQADRLA